MAKALYRKWRPQVFDDVFGQDHITTTLKNEIKSNKFSHAYLFTGSRGTGKTTCSKILAKAVNCLNPKDGNPCLECENCRQIEMEKTLDVTEIDAASNNGVDNIRQLKEEAVYTPSVCKFRVYIIDETHMLSQGAFNALLKIMEEPPPHVLFILATTEVHKVPATILSRCQRFDFKRIDSMSIVDKLQIIASAEGFSITHDAALTIAKLSDGGMRDAISLTDQCWSISDEIDIELVKKVAAIAGREYIYALTQAIVDQDIADAITTINALYSDSKNLEQLCVEMTEFFRNIMLYKTAGTLDGIITAMPDEIEAAKNYSASFNMSRVMQIISNFQICRAKQSKVTDKRLELEMCFIRLCNNELDISLEGISARINDLENIIKAGGGLMIPAKDKISENPSILPQNNHQPPKTLSIHNPPDTLCISQDIVDVTQKFSDEISLAEDPKGMSENDSKQLPSTPLHKGEFEQWQEVLLNLKKTNQALHGLLMNSSAFLENNIIKIKSNDKNFLPRMMAMEQQRLSVEKAVKMTTGQQYRVCLSDESDATKKAPPIDRFISHAKAAGVEVIEEN